MNINSILAVLSFSILTTVTWTLRKTVLKNQDVNSRSGRNTRLEAKDLYSNNFISSNNVDIED